MPDTARAARSRRRCATAGGIVDDVVLVDDASDDDTVAIARSLGLTVLLHPMNRGYGANQKTCYSEALDRGADVVVMVHPDYQYDPLLDRDGQHDRVRRLRRRHRIADSWKYGEAALPLYKYVSNRALTLWQNLFTGAKLSAITPATGRSTAGCSDAAAPQNSDDFVFDNEMLTQCVHSVPHRQSRCQNAFRRFRSISPAASDAARRLA
jgi:glycosyltransferase involved in cell wall biosynthesis